MTTKEEEQKENPEAGENQENPEEDKEEEEEPVDIELQKEMKGLKISDSDFNEPNANSNTKKTNKKSKNPEDKKSKKKGQDFLDYANKNNIKINLEYEENKYQKKEDQKFGDKNGNKYYDKKQFNKGENKNDKNRQQQKQKYSGNKFDNYGQRQSQQNYYQRPAPKLVENKEILEYLEKMFSEENLNKDTYIRNRLIEDKILVDEIAAYNDIKRNNIDSQKIIDIIKDSQNLECVNVDNKNYIKIKNFDKLKLLTIEEILQNKRAMRMPKIPYMPMGGQPFYPPFNQYIPMQNNYYINNQPIYSNQNAFYPFYPVEGQ